MAGSRLGGVSSTLSSVRELVTELQRAEPGTWEFHQVGLVWTLRLNHEQTVALSGVLASGAAFSPPVAAALGGAISYILTVNELGGRNGVDIIGWIGTQGLVVMPRLGGLFAELVDIWKSGITGRTILDILVIAGSKSPALAATLQIPVVAGVLAAVQAGTPLGWALAAGVGVVAEILGEEPNPNQHGGIHADRDHVLEWERFRLSQVGPENQVALLSWQGFFSAQGGGGADVYANRPQVGPWETWRLVDHRDGTVSFQATVTTWWPRRAGAASAGRTARPSVPGRSSCSNCSLTAGSR
jgi:hypothetical protein